MYCMSFFLPVLEVCVYSGGCFLSCVLWEVGVVFFSQHSHNSQILAQRTEGVFMIVLSTQDRKNKEVLLLQYVMLGTVVYIHKICPVNVKVHFGVFCFVLFFYFKLEKVPPFILLFFKLDFPTFYRINHF